MDHTPLTIHCMPCPRCGKQHEPSEYKPQPQRQRVGSRGIPHAPDDVQCECGAVLRHVVPLFCVDVFGWHWKIL